MVRRTPKINSSITKLKSEINKLEQIKKQEEERRKLEQRLKILKQSGAKTETKRLLNVIGKKTFKRLRIIESNLVRIGRGVI